MNDVFRGKGGQWSSKRIVGAACIAFSMALVLMAFILSDFADIAPNIQVVSLQYLAVGGGMITAGIFEKQSDNNLK